MSTDQKPFEAANRFAGAEFALNPEPRCPCILLLDTSGSMEGASITSLNAGIQQFQDELQKDALAAKRVEVCIITFGPVKTVTDFVGAASFAAPKLVAEGLTPMGEAVLAGLDALDKRKATYKENGIAYYRPWMFLITDGAPTDEIGAAATRLKAAEGKKGVAFFGVGVEGADMEALKQLSVRTPLKLQGLQFRELFSWLSSSLQRVSQSQVGQEVALPAVGWGSV